MKHMGRLVLRGREMGARGKAVGMREREVEGKWEEWVEEK